MKSKATELRTLRTRTSDTSVVASMILSSHQARTNIQKDEKVDLVTDSHSLLPRSRNYFSQPLNVHGVNDVMQTEIQTAKPPAPEPGASEVEMVIEKLKGHKSPGTDQIPADVIKVGGRTIRSKINKLYNSTRNREEMPEQWKEYLFIRWVIKKTVVIIKAYHLSTTYNNYPTSCCQH